MEEFWIDGILKQSLHQEILIQLNLEERRGLVDNQPWNMVLHMPGQPDRTLLPATKITDAFILMNKSLLILGNPGSGKTTVLLELARDAIQSAKQDITQPIPVVFLLTTWARQRGPLIDWIIQEFETQYSIPREVAKLYIENEELLLLFDGLDEVEQIHREACVQAINEFRQIHLIPMAICSRTEEYEALARRLKLNGAVVIQPLTLEQVTNYLESLGTEYIELRKMVLQYNTIANLTQSPLMLNLIILSQPDQTQERLKILDTLRENPERLFDIYVQRMYERRKVGRHYTIEQIRHWLSWLALYMVMRSKSVFTLENFGLNSIRLMDLLPNQVYIFALIVPIIASSLVVGITSGILGKLATGQLVWMTLGLAVGFIVGLLITLFPPKESEKLRSLNVLRWLWQNGVVGLCVGIFLGAVLYLTGTLFQDNITNSPTYGLRGALLGFLFFGCLGSFIWKVIVGPKIDIMMGILAGILFGIILGVGFGLSHWVSNFKVVNIQLRDFQGLLEFLLVGLISYPFVYYFFGGSKDIDLIELLLLLLLTSIIGMIAAFIGLLARGWINQLGLSLTEWIIILGLVFSAFFGLSFREIEVKLFPGEGIRQSMRNGAIAGLVVGLSFEIFFVMILNIQAGLAISSIFGTVTFLIFGGMNFIFYNLLRLNLFIHGFIPLDYAGFLDYATELTFLRRIGRGYLFIHRLLFEYFAKDIGFKIFYSDPFSQMTIIHQLGLTYLNQENWEEAAKYFEESLRICRELKDKGTEIVLLNDLAVSLSKLDKWDLAQSLYRESVQIAKELNNPYQIDLVLHNLAYEYFKRNQDDEAIQTYEKSAYPTRAFEAFELQRSKYYSYLGKTYANLGNWEKAIELFNISSDSSSLLYDYKAQAFTYYDVGNAYKELGKYEKASTNFDNSIFNFENIEDFDDTIFPVEAKIMLDIKGNKLALSEIFCKDYLKVYRKHKLRKHEARILLLLGKIYNQQNNYDEALHITNESIQIFRETESKHDEGAALKQLGEIYKAQGQHEKTMNIWQDAAQKLDPNSLEHHELIKQLKEL